MHKIIYVLPLALLLATVPNMSFAEGTLQSELVYRASLGRADDVKLLLSQGASPNETNDDGVPVLSLASARKDEQNKEVVDLLIKAGANVNGTDKQGQTALFYAAREGNKDIVTDLLNNKINYYALDNHGDVARTIAAKGGHQDIVETMDNFVKGESKKVDQQYQDLDAQIKKQYADQQAAAAQAAEDQKKIDVAPQAPAKPTGPTPEEIEARRATPEFDKDMHDYAMENCAFQYWYFVQSNKQSNELSTDELEIAVNSHKEGIEAHSKQVADTYELERPYLDGISRNVKQRIFNALSEMPSNTYRHEQGVGKMDDMKERCDHIANSWQEQAQASSTKKDKGEKGGKGGGKGSGKGGGAGKGAGRQSVNNGIGTVGKGGKQQGGGTKQSSGDSGRQKHTRGEGRQNGGGNTNSQTAPITNNNASFNNGGFSTGGGQTIQR